MKKLQSLGTGLGLAFLSSASFAAAPDVSAVVTEIGGAAAPVASIGAAVLLVMVGIKVFKWIRSVL
ncbi:major capsid protein [Thauera aromatica]|uniref:major capsid protein n=1 Tax=Thauera aromatica TaxID=59405 RepID=UPI001FFD18F6|nr:major capsid protein [Thauera aromatica]MCK2088646.1 major capsid protein [Thauera aromatica]